MATEDTQVKDREAEAVEAWLKAPDAGEPGEAIKDRIIRDPDIPEGVAMKFASITSAGWVYVYHTKTGDRSKINRNMLASQLRKKLEDGSYAFSLTPPRDRDGNIIKPREGTIKCLLHPDDPNRKHYAEMGFATCPKDNISSQHNLVQHMSHRHKVEWATIEKERTDKEKAEDREFQRSLYNRLAPQPSVVTQIEGTSKVQGLSNMVNSPAEAPLYVSDKPPKPKKQRGRPKKIK